MTTSQPKTRLLNNALWMMVWRWTDRLLGLISTIVLARLLTPYDFGIVAIAMIITGLLEIFSKTGVALALINTPDAGEEHWNTAWTIRFMFRTVIVLLLFPVAHLGSWFFSEDKVIFVIYALSLSLFMGGLANIGPTLFQKDLQFSKVFLLGFIARVASVIATIASAYYLKNYWALVIGTLVGTTFEMALSYIMHPHRPKFSLSRFDSLWGFSKWLFLNNLFEFFNKKATHLIIGRFLGAVNLGKFTVANGIATLPTMEITGSVAAALFPNLARLKGDNHLLYKTYKRILATISTLTFPVGVGICLAAEPAAQLLLGSKWTDTGISEIIKILAIWGILMGVRNIARPLFLAIDRPRTSAKIEGIELALFIPMGIAAATGYGLEEVLYTRVATICLSILLSFLLITRFLKESIVDLFKQIVAPGLSSIFMYYGVTALPLDNISSDPVLLTVIVISGMGFYSVAILITSFLGGFHNSAVYQVLSIFRKRITK